jgi:predicted N-acetyltransferase YhbS
VSVTDDGALAGYYSLSASSVVRDSAPGRLARNQPDPIPVVLLGRLAVDERFAGQGLGAGLLQHAVIQATRASLQIGARAILVHALRDDVVAFYERFGFRRFTDSSMSMYVLVADAAATAVAL